MEIYSQIVALVATTGIGAGVYSFLEILKPWLKGFYSIPYVKMVAQAITARLGIDNGAAYDALMKLLVFVVAYIVAWQMGANGDLLVLIGRTAETSYIGYACTAFVIASGDLAVNAFEQSRKTPNA